MNRSGAVLSLSRNSFSAAPPGEHPRYHIDLRVMEEAFATMPWALEPLARNGLRCHAQCFLMPHETMSLGLEQGLPWQRPWH